MTYKYYSERPSQLTKEFVQEEYTKLLARIEPAEKSESPDLWIKLYEDWNALRAFIQGEGSRVSYAHSKRMDDATWEEADRYYREETTPAADDGSSKMLDALLRSRHLDAIGEHFGPYLIKQLRVAVEPLAPVNSELRVKASDLGDKYDKIVAEGEVTVDGKKVTLAVARSLGSNADPRIRKEAYTAFREWFLQHHDELARIYDELVKLRDQMGRNLGHKNFIPLGYAGMGRTDYGPEQAKAFRDSIRKYAVPIQQKLHQQQAQALGTPTLKPWDAAYHPLLTLPSGVAPIETQLDKAQQVFDSLSPRLGKHFARMRAEGLIDLENRRAKRAGAFCTSFPDEGRVAIMCNSTGDQDDVSTLMHEMGHAFQAWESQKIEAIDLQWPTSDAAEIHSMGMEYLSMAYMSIFFSDEHLEKYRRNRWREAIELMCYIAVVDEFQHWVYENPNVTTKERDASWARIWDIYKPGVDFTGVEQYKYARWYAQGHIFQMPFYYIDYAIAETGAMQFGLLAAEDLENALNTYIKICEIGGTKSVLDIFKSAGLRSPFEPSTMRDLMDHAAVVLGIEESVEA
jgi:M3 family oligoendopeptidase